MKLHEIEAACYKQQNSLAENRVSTETEASDHCLKLSSLYVFLLLYLHSEKNIMLHSSRFEVVVVDKEVVNGLS